MSNRNEPKCTKVSYGSKKFADDDIKRIAKKSTRTNVPIRSYLCTKCNTWHLTRRVDFVVTIETLTEKVKKQKEFITNLKVRLKAYGAEYDAVVLERDKLIVERSGSNNSGSKKAKAEYQAEKYYTLLTKQNEETNYLYDEIKAILPEHLFSEFQEKFDSWRKENRELPLKSKLKSMIKKEKS
jgi:uncharacterized protein YlaI